MEEIRLWIAGNWIEISGAVISLVYLYFSVRQIIWLWPFGLLSALFYIWIYYYSGFYADMSLQVYYVAVSIYGWHHWSAGRKGGNGTGKLPVSRINLKTAIILATVFLVSWIGISFVLIRFTDSQVPVMDGLTTAGSIVATWMLARKILEHWILWIIIDSISLGLYFYKELYATVVLFAVYTIMAFIGYFAWKKEMKSN